MLETDKQNQKEKKLHFSLGLGAGLIDPADINDYIYNYYVNFIHFENEGFTEDNSKADINLFIKIDTKLSLSLSKRLESYIDYSASVGYSSVEDVDMIGMENNRLNILLNLSPSLGVDYYIINNERNSVYLGGAINWNKLILNVNTDDNTFSGSAPGIKLNLGYSPDLSHLQYEIHFNIAQTEAKRKNSEWSSVDYPDNLSFSGLSLNFRYVF